MQTPNAAQKIQMPYSVLVHDRLTI